MLFIVLTVTTVSCTASNVVGAASYTTDVKLQLKESVEKTVTISVGGENKEIGWTENVYKVIYVGNGSLPSSFLFKPHIYGDGSKWRAFKDYTNKRFTTSQTIDGATWVSYLEFETTFKGDLTANVGSSSYSYSVFFVGEGESSTDLHYFKMTWTFNKIEKK